MQLRAPRSLESNSVIEQSNKTEFILPHVAWEDQNWRQAMIKELDAVVNNKTWVLEEMPTTHRALRPIWVYKIKTDGDNIKYKARLTIDGSAQQQGVDYTESYSPVIKLVTFRILLAFAATSRLTLYQYDFDNAFLNATISDDDPPVYMDPPFSYDFQSACLNAGLDPNSNIKLRLKKTLYGLKQSPRKWYLTISEFFINCGFTNLQSDICLYQRRIGNLITIIALYVDDMIVATNDETFYSIFKQKLLTNYKVKDLGLLTNYLGMRISQTSEGITIDQHNYISKLISKYRLENCKDEVYVPLSKSDFTFLEKSNSSNSSTKDTQQYPYRELIGSLMYAMLGTRPDIAHAIGFLSRFNNCATKVHFRIALKVLKYLKTTIDRKILYRYQGHTNLLGFVDADYATCKQTRRSTSGYIFYLNDGPISWKSMRQSVVALSSNEAEFISLTEAAKEATYLRNLLQEIGLSQSLPTPLYEDNTGAISLSNNPVQHGKLKHVSIRRFWLREKVINRTIIIHHIQTSSQVADLLTKATMPSTFTSLIDSLFDISKLKINNETTWQSDDIIPVEHDIDETDVELLEGSLNDI